MDRRYRDVDFLRRRYADADQSAGDIADDCGVTKSTISHWLSRHGITDGAAYERTQCDNCGDYFRYASSLRAGTYCSNACANDQRKRQVAVECAGCGETFQRRASLDTEYCSIGCWGQEIRTEGDFYCGIWNEQRRKALEHDEFQCVECGISNSEHNAQFGHELDVHHRVPVRQFAKWDCPIRDAHVLRNLVTYCRTHLPDAPGSTTEPE
ncbi:hypothetical protein [Haloarcula rara]|uniref:hypothetical protein n=1 Tax=Haloarcula rara TaxID=3033387 RepID=UPI0023E8AE4A|nr:hypothetical protein [Halomicroarcula sp. SHR3]